MITSYFTVALRNLLRYKLFSAINIGGLAIGLAAFWVIALYLANELSYDRHQANAGRIFRIAQHAQWNGGSFHGAITPVPYASAMKADFPVVEETVRIDMEGGGVFRNGTQEFTVGDMIYADASFFRVFSFNFIYGDPGTALSKPSSIVITKDLATSIFGKPDAALNKSLDFDGGSMVVTGVIEDVPANSHFTFRGVRPMGENLEGPWQNSYLYTYVLLRNGEDIKSLEEKMPAFFERHLKAPLGEMDYKAELQPLTSIHLGSNLEFEMGANGNMTYVYIFSVVAGLILLVASINYMNLSTARSSLRIRETGLRKVVGSRRSQLVTLFLTESVFITFIACVLSVVIITFAMTLFEALTGNTLDMWQFGIWPVVASLATFSMIAGLLSGIYPALFLSGFKVVPALKGLAGGHEGSTLLRRGLVTLQFVITVAMIAGSIVIYRQLNFVMHKDLGFNKKQVVTFHIDDFDLRSKVPAIREALLKSPLIEEVGTAGNPIGNNNIGVRDYKLEEGGGAEELTRKANYFTIDEDFIPVLQVQVKEGRNFSKEIISDKDRAVIVNAALVGDAGWDSAVGKKIQMGADSTGKPLMFEIVGVVNDFSIYSLQHKVEPLILQLPAGAGDKDNVYVRVATSDIPGALSFIESAYAEFSPSGTFRYTFLDDNFGRQYRAEELQARLLLVFTVLAISIACLGLFGLITFIAEQRRKEIGIRKVLGGHVVGIVMLLAKDLVVLIIVAALMATPLSWYAMNMWLEGFAYRISIGGWTFVGAGLFALIIAMVTICSQAAKSAMANPVDSLRAE